MRKNWVMLFKLGLTVVVVVSILLFYLNNTHEKDSAKDRLTELMRSNHIDDPLLHKSAKDLLPHESDGPVNGHESLHPGEVVRMDQPRNDVAGAADSFYRDLKDGESSKANRQQAVEKDREHVNNLKKVNDFTNHEKFESENSLNGGNKKAQAPDLNEMNDHTGNRESVKEDHNLMNNAGMQWKSENAAEEKLPEILGGENTHTKEVSGLQPLHRRVGKKVPGEGANLIHLAVVACGDRADEVMVLLKSAVAMTPSVPLVFHIFAEKELHIFFTQQFLLWPWQVLEEVEYRIYDITFPKGENAEEWKSLFKPCASQRLFLPPLLTGVDSLIYVDTDILFVSPLSKLWAFFSRFNATQLVALAPEHEDTSTGWYNRFARHPYVPPLGVNSGVMLMNLTRLRQSKWLRSMLDYYKEYRLKITWGDQDLINIYFHFNPEQLYIYTCDWNYRPDHCMYMSVCLPADKHGAFILHGCRRVMHNDKQPAFKAVFQAFRDYRLGEDVEFGLLPKLKMNLDGVKNTPCGKVAHIFFKQIEDYVADRHHIQDSQREIYAPAYAPAKR